MADLAWLNSMTVEDGLIEDLSAFFWLAGFVSCLWYLLIRGGYRHRRMMILFCIVCFICLGEEISWGQRIFHITTPNILLKLNMQGEFNFHNIRLPGLEVSPQTSWRAYFETGRFDYRMILNPFFLFRVFVGTFFFIFPIVGLWSRGSRFLSLIGYYPPKVYFIIIFFCALAVTLLIQIPYRHAQSAGETQEMLYALFIAIYVLDVCRSSESPGILKFK
jgi:hypothetical protein